jgi:hypothetical protein
MLGIQAPIYLDLAVKTSLVIPSLLHSRLQKLEGVIVIPLPSA